MHPSISDLKLQVPLRAYQQKLLNLVSTADARSDQRLHIASPPGSGKTLMGLELARRLGEPTVVFAPTTTIQQQWHDEVGLLLPQGLEAASYVSTDVNRLAPITVLTYQVLSTTADPDAGMIDVARHEWADELVRTNRVADGDAAHRYLDALDSAVFRREARARIRALRRRLLARDEVDIHRVLHDNARQLVDRIVAAGTGTIVLDECHHLLDHWALVLVDLIERLERQRPDRLHVIGLTATLPSPATALEQHNYEWLFGEVDAEVPTPAVVKDGVLAPYRDLAVFVTPTQDEQRFLRSVQDAFDATVVDVAADEAFLSWVVAQVSAPSITHAHAAFAESAAEVERRLDAWGSWLREDAKLAIAVLRAHQRFGLALPAGVPIPAAAAEPFGTDDWLTLLERWVTTELMMSADPDDRYRLHRVREAVGGFGVTITTRGLRHGRPPADVVLALSDAKAQGCADILTRERGALGERLRALVVTDVDRVVTAAARLRGVLDADSGSARRLHRHLVATAGSNPLQPVLVTGSTVRAGNGIADDLATQLNLWFARRELDVFCRAQPVDDRIQELTGQGRDWTPRHYVAALTDLFTQGLTRCLVGTRGLFGEGWDAPACNVLVDLTAATTPTAQEQLRGRVLRLDPAWAGKVAHRWDVVCVAPDVSQGGTDLARFVRRHAALWGVAIADPPAIPAPVIRGVRHVDPQLPDAWPEGPGGPVDVEALAAVTRRCRTAVGDRSVTRSAWGIGSTDFRGTVITRTQVHPAAGVEVIAAPQSPDITTLVGSATSAAAAVTGAFGGLTAHPLLLGATGVLGAATAAAAWQWRRRRRQTIPRTFAALVDGRIAASDLVVLLTLLGEALRGAMIERSLLHHATAAARVAVEPAGRTLSVELRPGADELLASDHHRFAQALGQLLGPVDQPRYLIVLRHGRRPVAFAVPDELGRNRGHAEAFAAQLQQRAHGVGLVYARSDDGARLLTQVWSQQRLPLMTNAYDRWT